ncbi:class I SAM-dependent methyltransferase [Roseibium sp. AS2]|uniref:class I SAM-dependent methyltransferase n=1 Tax=Roseibium sp. AS2 TaxID=3135781 RepID=UPI00317F7F73
MSGFSTTWLALREPLDLAARNTDVEAAFLDSLPSGPVRILDLASGAGSTVAALAAKGVEPAGWLLCDHDSALLEHAGQRWRKPVEQGTGRIDLRQIDLARDLEQLPFADVAAVTTSAFLDLVSEAFVERLVEQVVKARKPFLASLTYDGRVRFDPEAPFDSDILAAHDRHQRTNKGFGPALGPEAASRAIALFEAAGYRVVQGPSDWRVAPHEHDFLMEFLGGWVRVGEDLNLPSQALETWWRDRARQIRSEELSVTVGHVDFAALPSC